jgi:hypothetical protein
MLRKMLLVFALCGFAALGARAQDENTVEVFGGYSYLHFHTNPSTNLNGWELAGQYRFRDWLGGVAFRSTNLHAGAVLALWALAAGRSTSEFRWLWQLVFFDGPRWRP